jgi:hypothetical protein
MNKLSMTFSKIKPKRFKSNSSGGKMIKKSIKNSMISRPMATTVNKNKAKKSQEPPYKTVSNSSNNPKFSASKTPGTVPNAKTSSWPKSKCKSTRPPKSSSSVSKDSRENNTTPKSSTCNN